MTEKSEKTVLQKLIAVNSKPTAETFPELPDALVWRKFPPTGIFLVAFVPNI